jgi:hypothetical protein
MKGTREVLKGRIMSGTATKRNVNVSERNCY